MACDTKIHQETFNYWLTEYVENYGSDIVFGFYIKPIGHKRNLFAGTVEYNDWLDSMRSIYNSKQM